MGTPPDIKEILQHHGSSEGVTPEEAKEIESIGTEKDSIVLPAAFKEEVKPEAPSPAAQPSEIPVSHDIRTLISKMRLPEKVKLAMFGNMVARALLIRDTNKIIPMVVLKNPQLTVKEVEDFIRNPNMSEFVIRAIAGSATWMKSYNVKANLVANPKTPGDLALKWLRYLSPYDLKKLAKSKNVPNVISLAARKRVVEMQKKRQ
jgi:hypothetical protein